LKKQIAADVEKVRAILLKNIKENT